MTLSFEEFCYQRAGVKEITDDILLKAKFTNLHRELDRNTRYWLANCKSIDQWLVAFRYNKVQTFEACVFDDRGNLQVSESYNNLLSLSQFEKLNTKAYLCTGWYREGDGAMSRSVDYLAYELKPAILQILQSQHSIYTLAKQLQHLPSIGPFFAYQLALSLSYHFSEIQFSNKTVLGPGSKMGIKMIGRSFDQLLAEPFAHCLLLDAAAMEHALCEYSKYYRISQKGNIRKPAKYVPSTQPLVPLVLPAHYAEHYTLSFPHANPGYKHKLGL